MKSPRKQNPNVPRKAEDLNLRPTEPSVACNLNTKPRSGHTVMTFDELKYREWFPMHLMALYSEFMCTDSKAALTSAETKVHRFCKFTKKLFE